MARNNGKSYEETSREYADMRRLEMTAERMGESQAAKAYRDEASQIRQGFFGPDPKR